MCERELETEQNCNISTPTLMAISVVSLVLLMLNRRSSFLLSAGFLYRILSPTHLISNSIGGPKGPFCRVVAFSTTSCHQRVSKLTDLSSPSYIIVPSPTQSLEWHVWSSSSGNNCYAVHRSLSSGASVYNCTAGFYLVPFYEPSSRTPMEIYTSAVFGMAYLAGSKVNIQQKPAQLYVRLSIRPLSQQAYHVS